MRQTAAVLRTGWRSGAVTLQALHRAEAIGETTGGGAHPTQPFPISAADEAYRVAYALALRHVTELADVPPLAALEADPSEVVDGSGAGVGAA